MYLNTHTESKWNRELTMQPLVSPSFEVFVHIFEIVSDHLSKSQKVMQEKKIPSKMRMSVFKIKSVTHTLQCKKLQANTRKRTYHPLSLLSSIKLVCIQLMCRTHDTTNNSQYLYKKRKTKESMQNRYLLTPIYVTPQIETNNNKALVSVCTETIFAT